MKITTQSAAKGLLVSLAGALDESAASSLTAGLDLLGNTSERHIFIDFAKVTKVSASGLRMLLPYVQQFQQQKKKLIFCNLNSEHLAAINSSGFNSLVTVVDSL